MDDSFPQRVRQAARHIANLWAAKPTAGIVLGSGLGELARHLYGQVTIEYATIPHFPLCTATSHRGQLVCGELAGQPVAVMNGRFHAYEGYSPWQLMFPIHVLHALGIQLLVVTNAGGGLNPQYKPGDLVLIEDHINLIPCRDSRGLGMRTWPGRGSGQRCQYDSVWLDRARQVARQRNVDLHGGVYVGVLGPNFETRAEYRFLRRIGGDVVGMSTVPEVMAAAQLRLPVLALSVVTNASRPDRPARTASHDVVHMARSTEPRLRDIVIGALSMSF